ncbi:MAG: amino acid ABC transporter substrate-binding protein [Terriglobia bacterium]
MLIKTVRLFSLLVVLSLVAAACGTPSGTAPTEPVAGADTGGADTGEEPVQTAGQGEILQRVLSRGSVVCGVHTELAGFGYLDAAGNNLGFDIDLCRAVAAAVLGDPTAVEFVPITAADRGPVLQTGEVDLVARNMTLTSKRDAEWGNFTTTMFYDGQGFMVRAASGISTIEDMNGAAICVTSGTTTESNLAALFADRGLEYEAVIFEETSAVYSTYDEGRCDVATSDKSQLAAVRTGLTNPDEHVILDITISKEPLTPAVPHGDDTWFDTVKIVMYALINAEELGVTQANVEEMKNSENGAIRTLLGTGDDWGYVQLGLDADSMARAIAAVGNYGEIYNRYMGPEGLAFTLPRGLNELWSNGGLIYAPPVR